MRTRRPAAALPLMLTTVLSGALLAGCGLDATMQDQVSAPAAAPAPPAAITVDIDPDATLPAGRPVTVSVADGTMTAVRLDDATGTALVDQAVDGMSWTSPTDLPPYQSFALHVDAVNAQGTPSSLVREFRTGAPATVLAADVQPYGDAVVGIGRPLIVRLSTPVPDALKASVERRLTVEASKPLGPTSWSWVSDSELRFRPQEFWPSYTSVTVHVNLAGLHPSAGVWGAPGRDVSFRTGAAQVIRIDARTHQATVERDGVVIRTMPVSLGKPGYDTRSGIKVVMSRHRTFRMQSSSYGVSSGPNAYDLTVPYAMRVTNSGEFLHGAPWNTKIGAANTSHGCTNLTLADARWLYDNVQIGDPVTTTGTPRTMESWNGWGDWNLSWSMWTARSSLR